MRFHLIILVLAVSAILLLTGCGPDYKEANLLYNAGNYRGAAAEIGETEGTSADLLSNLYLGSCHFMAGDFDAANLAFRKAEAGFLEQDTSWNWGNAYLGKTFDGIATHAYLALALLAKGKPDNARVFFNRLDASQGKAADRNYRYIRQQQEETRRQATENGDANAMLRRTQDNAANQRALQKYQQQLATWGAYADYENPAARFLSGLFRLLHRVDRDDAEKAVFHLRKAYGMTESPVAKDAWDLAEAFASTRISQRQLAQKVFVVFENGLCPEKEEYRIDLVIPYDAPVHVGFALPQLRQRGEAFPHLLLRQNGIILAKTTPLCDFDRIAATEFQHDLPALIAAAVTETVVKTVLQIIAIEVMRKQYGDDYAFLTGLAGSALSEATTSADLRNWDLLPKNYQAAIFDRPADGKIQVAAHNGIQLADLALPPAGPVLVYVKAPTAGPAPLVLVLPGNLPLSR